jgi:hypothetical protein
MKGWNINCFLAASLRLFLIKMKKTFFHPKIFVFPIAGWNSRKLLNLSNIRIFIALSAKSQRQYGRFSVSLLKKIVPCALWFR